MRKYAVVYLVTLCFFGTVSSCAQVIDKTAHSDYRYTGEYSGEYLGSYQFDVSQQRGLYSTPGSIAFKAYKLIRWSQ